jgi:hypothetical protein
MATPDPSWPLSMLTTDLGGAQAANQRICRAAMPIRLWGRPRLANKDLYPWPTTACSNDVIRWSGR